jgi:hypothetical protein
MTPRFQLMNCPEYVKESAGTAANTRNKPVDPKRSRSRRSETGWLFFSQDPSIIFENIAGDGQTPSSEGRRDIAESIAQTPAMEEPQQAHNSQITKEH